MTNFRFVSILSVAVVLAAAWESPAQDRGLLWAADADGGKPYVFRDPADPSQSCMGTIHKSATEVTAAREKAQWMPSELGRI